MKTNLKLNFLNKFSVCVNTKLFNKKNKTKIDFESMYFKQMEDFVKLSNKKVIFLL